MVVVAFLPHVSAPVYLRRKDGACSREGVGPVNGYRRLDGVAHTHAHDEQDVGLTAGASHPRCACDVGRPGLSHGQQAVGAACLPCEGWEAERAAEGRVLLARPRGRLIEDGSDVRRRMRLRAWQHMMDLRRGGLVQPGTHLLQAVPAAAAAGMGSACTCATHLRHMGSPVRHRSSTRRAGLGIWKVGSSTYTSCSCKSEPGVESPCLLSNDDVDQPSSQSKLRPRLLIAAVNFFSHWSRPLHLACRPAQPMH